MRGRQKTVFTPSFQAQKSQSLFVKELQLVINIYKFSLTLFLCFLKQSETPFPESSRGKIYIFSTPLKRSQLLWLLQFPPERSRAPVTGPALMKEAESSLNEGLGYCWACQSGFNQRNRTPGRDAQTHRDRERWRTVCQELPCVIVRLKNRSKIS